MNEFESPTYVLDLCDSSNREKIENAQPNQKLAVRVKPQGDKSAEAIAATGERSADGKVFDVVVDIAAGRQSHAWTWRFLQEACYARRH